ncbi:MAG: xylulokinase [Actinobacteria bacterium]|nr:xylulokinase [Actinomycetota bacterium]
MNYTIGIDVSTTGVKSILVSQDGNVVADSLIEYSFSSPKPGWAEHDPREWHKATLQSLRNLSQKNGSLINDVIAIGITGQMHGSVFLDKDDEVIRPALLWNDQRTFKECAEIEAKVGKSKLLEEVSNPALTGFTLPKILWLQNNEPDNFARLRKILLPKDYVRFKLTGTYATDVADASGTLLFDVKNRKWSDFMLNTFELYREWLPQCFESPEITGYLMKEAADYCGLKEGIPFIAGGGDQAAGGVGNGIVGKGLVSVTIGTSGVIFVSTVKPSVESGGKLHTFCHAVPGMWHVMGVTLSAAGSMKWFAENIGPDAFESSSVEERNNIYQRIDAQAAEIAPGSERLVFLPYLTGERTPYPDPNARGVFFGLTNRHGKPHIARAVMEGVAFSLKDCMNLVLSMDIKIKKVMISGGGAKSGLWRQITADVLERNLVTLNTTEGPAFGVAILGFVGTKVYRDVPTACKSMIKEVTVTKANSDNFGIYRKLYSIYANLYPALSPLFREL